MFCYVVSLVNVYLMPLNLEDQLCSISRFTDFMGNQLIAETN